VQSLENVSLEVWEGWLHKVGTVYSKHARKNKWQSSTTCKFFEKKKYKWKYKYEHLQKVTCTSAHVQCVHNNCAKFGEWKSRCVRGVDYTI
jgi:hypothetical protein